MGFDQLLAGLATVFTPEHLLFALLGCVLGMLVGVLPGFGPAAAVSLLIPVTFGLEATSAIIMLAAILYGGAYGGTTTAVLLRIPGEASSIATTLDGYQMAKKGRGGPARVIAALASFVGGLIGVVGFVVVAPFSRPALEFGAPELFLVSLLGFALITSFAGNNPAKALLSAAAGLAIATVGVDSGVGIARFTFDMPELFDGLGLVVHGVLATHGHPVGIHLQDYCEIKVLDEIFQEDRNKLLHSSQFRFILLGTEANLGVVALPGHGGMAPLPPPRVSTH